MTAAFAVAPAFHLQGTWSDRLRVAKDGGWGIPDAGELAHLTETPAVDSGTCSLFVMPAHLRTRFWDMLNDEAAEGTGNFESFSDDLADFLAFKELPPPADAVCELLIQDAAGQVTTEGFWALINFGEDPVMLAWPALQLRLNPGEGCRLAQGSPADIVPPAQDELNALVAIRMGAITV